tara:strand:- start:15300 stop:15833 length:534 start_codon:yes stop_codon:yes gene_type:complete
VVALAAEKDNIMSTFFDFLKNQPSQARSFPLQGYPQAQPMPMYGQQQGYGQQMQQQQPQRQGQGMMQPQMNMQQPYGGSALPGTQAPQVGQQQWNMTGEQEMSDYERMIRDQIKAGQDEEAKAAGMPYRNAGMGAQAKDMGDGGMSSIMAMAQGRSGQQQRQPMGPGTGYQLPRGLL